MASAEVRKLLLSKILSMEGVFQGKYSTAFNILKSIIKLEEKERNKDKLPKEIFDRFMELEKKTSNLDNKIINFPLLVVEQYFLRNSENLDKYIYMMYGDLEYGDFKVIDLYKILEDFFQDIYLLAVEISDYYSIEIKLKSGGNDSKSDHKFL